MLEVCDIRQEVQNHLDQILVNVVREAELDDSELSVWFHILDDLSGALAQQGDFMDNYTAWQERKDLVQHIRGLA